MSVTPRVGHLAGKKHAALFCFFVFTSSLFVVRFFVFRLGGLCKPLQVSELIHRSDTFPNLDFARVSVHFVDILDVEGSEDDYEEASVLLVAFIVYFIASERAKRALCLKQKAFWLRGRALCRTRTF